MAMSSTHIRTLTTHKQLIKYVKPNIACYLIDLLTIKLTKTNKNKDKNKNKKLKD
jgi:hypothetical protein